jgi:hypothetical protein
MADKPVCMTRKSAVKEHEHLVGVLRSGSNKQRQREATDQAAELKQYRGSRSRKRSRRGARR